jgi:DNA-directed RNA polymerase subunit N (RpoN/RPB10)
MYIYVRCLCGYPIGQLYGAFTQMCKEHKLAVKQGKIAPDAPIGYILDELNVKKRCCRTHMMTCEQFNNYYWDGCGSDNIPLTYSASK